MDNLNELTRIDDSLEARDNFLAINKGARTTDLPEDLAGGRNIVILDVASVQLVVGATNVELRVTGGQLEREHALVDSLLIDSRPEVGVLCIRASAQVPMDRTDYAQS